MKQPPSRTDPGLARIETNLNRFHRLPTHEDAGSIQLLFEVQDVDAEYDRLRDALEFSTQPQDTDWGYRVTRTEDPVGHTVELYTPDDREP